MSFRYVGKWEVADGTTMAGHAQFTRGHAITLPALSDNPVIRTPDSYRNWGVGSPIHLTLVADNLPHHPYVVGASAAYDQIVGPHPINNLPDITQPDRAQFVIPMPQIPELGANNLYNFHLSLTGDTWMLYPNRNLTSYFTVYLEVSG